MKKLKSALSSVPLLFSLFFIGLSGLIFVLTHHFSVHISSDIALTTRWIAIAGLLVYGWKRKSLTVWIFVSMAIGITIGHDFPVYAVHLKVLGKIFLHLIKCIIAPLLISTLVVGIAGHSNLKQVGRMGIKSLVYFEVVTTLALIIGLIAINVSQAGVGIHLPAGTATEKVEVVKRTASEIILHTFPENIAKAVADGEMLQIVVFAVLFGIGLAMVQDKYRKPLVEFFEGISETMFKFTNIIMYFAPFGVGGAIAYTVANMGLGVLSNLLQLLLTLYAALFAFAIIVLLPIAFVAKVPIRRFLQAVSEPMSIAFATASSESALPRAMEEMEELGVPRKIVAFVMPTGYSFNLDGTTLYLSLATVFVAQAAGMHLSITQQLIIGLTLMLTSKGIAGVSRASMVILLGTAATFGLPTEPIFIIVGIDALMDMGRTAINVLGNCLATVVVAKWEGEFTLSTKSHHLEEVENPTFVG